VKILWKFQFYFIQLALIHSNSLFIKKNKTKMNN
jgi:hypothetical protein